MKRYASILLAAALLLGTAGCASSGTETSVTNLGDVGSLDGGTSSGDSSVGVESPDSSSTGVPDTVNKTESGSVSHSLIDGSTVSVPPVSYEDGSSSSASVPPAADGDESGSSASVPSVADGDESGSSASVPPAADGDEGGSSASVPPAMDGDEGGSSASVPPATDRDTSDSDVSVPPEPDTSAITSLTTAPSTQATTATVATTVPATDYAPTDIGGTGAGGDDYSGVISDLGEAAGDFDTDRVYSDALEAPSGAIAAEGAIMDGDIAYEPTDPSCIPVPCPPVIPDQPQPSAGLLTGGEWRDNDHWADWKELYSSHSDWEWHKTEWRIDRDTRIRVTVTADGKPIEGAKVSCEGFTAVTDNKGKAYLFYPAKDGPTEKITVTYGGVTETLDGVTGDTDAECELSGVTQNTQKTLDFMIMCDTTGSMSDELSYLQEELKDIISKVRSDNANIPTRLSVNFYRDDQDEYVVREYPFTEDYDAAEKAINEQYAEGGGDTPEAVHTALDSAINNHDWNEDAVKIMFLVLDAPPHSDPQIIDSVNASIEKAAAMGIRVIPIASSGVDKATEYLLRTMAFYTGGTYTFLTDDSGIGYGHTEPTVGAYNVEKLNDMMVRIVNGYLE